MKIEKGKIIYIIVLSILAILLFMPSSLLVFRIPLSEVFSDSYNVSTFMPDILSLLLLISGYITLKLFYTKRSLYIQLYPLFIFVIFILWTIIIQFK